MTDQEITYQVLQLARRHDLGLDDLSLCFGDMKHMLGITCSDVFVWGSADVEVVTAENFPRLAAHFAAFEQLEKADDKQPLKDRDFPLCYAFIAWVAKERGMRPQGAYYTEIPKSLWPLFDSYGPARTTGLGNPCEPGTYKPERQA